MYKIKKYSCFIFVLILSFTINLNVFASSVTPTPTTGYDKFMGGSNIKGFNSWETTDKKSFFVENIASYIWKMFGICTNRDRTTLQQANIDYLIEKGKIEDADSYDEYIASHMTADDSETNITVDATMSDDLHDALKQYLDTNTGWYYVPTTSYKDIDATKFVNKTGYDSFMAYCNANMSENKIVKIETFNMSTTYYTGVSDQFVEFSICDFDSFVSSSVNTGYIQVRAYFEWESPESYIKACSYSDGDVYQQLDLYNVCTGVLNTSDSTKPIQIYTNSGGTRKVFKSVDDMKGYSVGQQPYYASSKWTNYVSGQGNTISQQEFNAPVTYDNVVNNINDYSTTNNGITDEQLQAILDAMLKASENGGGSGGSGDSGGGTGLGGLLDGLGAVGNVIMAILGKLLEIVSKALTLLSDTVLNIIDKVPKGFTDLLVAIFPFIPEEWTTAIGLSLVLAVVAGIVGIFKK